jgi:hypothetical protein
MPDGSLSAYEQTKIAKACGGIRQPQRAFWEATPS